VKEIVFTRRFERDFRRLKKRLSPHILDSGNTASKASTPGLLLIYRTTRRRIVFHRTGTHRELFRPSRKEPRSKT